MITRYMHPRRTPRQPHHHHYRSIQSQRTKGQGRTACRSRPHIRRPASRPYQDDRLRQDREGGRVMRLVVQCHERPGDPVVVLISAGWRVWKQFFLHLSLSRSSLLLYQSHQTSSHLDKMRNPEAGFAPISTSHADQVVSEDPVGSTDLQHRGRQIARELHENSRCDSIRKWEWKWEWVRRFWNLNKQLQYDRY